MDFIPGIKERSIVSGTVDKNALRLLPHYRFVLSTFHQLFTIAFVS